MSSNLCVCCGAEIPEGRQICWNCEHNSNLSDVKEENQKVKENENV